MFEANSWKRHGIIEKVIILVVEDEAIIRMGTVQMLKDAGYAVVEASNADAAIEILESREAISAPFSPISKCPARFAA